jgi:hypothetical protein
MNITNPNEIPLALKEWIEDTRLFAFLQWETNNVGWHGVLPTLFAADENRPMTLALQPGVVINRAEDLPIELIEEFYINSPFYKGENNNNLKQLTNEK